MEGIIKVGSRWEIHSDAILYIFDKLDTTRGGLSAWVEVRYTGFGEEQLVHFGTYNLMGARTVKAIAKDIEQYTADPEEELRRIIYDVIQDTLEGDLPVRLVNEPPISTPWVLKPLVAGVGVTSLIAPGSWMKSFLGTAVAATVASGSPSILGLAPAVTGPVMYLDWEADAATHSERLRAIASSSLKVDDIWYRSEKFPLYRSAEVLAKQADRLGASLLIVDSVMLARGGDSTGSDDTVRFYAALREIGRPCLALDHKSLEAIRRKIRGAYGSVVNENSARLVWEITAKMDTLEGVRLKLEPGKRNNIGALPLLGYEVTFDGEEPLESVNFRQVAATTIFGQEAENLSQEIRSYMLHRREAVTVNELADETMKAAGTIRQTLKRGNQFKNLNEGTAKEGSWILIEEDTSVELPNPFE